MDQTHTCAFICPLADPQTYCEGPTGESAAGIRGQEWAASAGEAPIRAEEPDSGPGGSIAMFMGMSVEPRLDWGLQNDSSS